jgi:hypothetical protein
VLPWHPKIKEVSGLISKSGIGQNNYGLTHVTGLRSQVSQLVATAWGVKEEKLLDTTKAGTPPSPFTASPSPFMSAVSVHFFPHFQNPFHFIHNLSFLSPSFFLIFIPAIPIHFHPILFIIFNFSLSI